jgi:large subunit ribosomal protein L9
LTDSRFRLSSACDRRVRMEIVLRETIENLGNAGDVVTVRPGYARNYLLPRKLAYLATPGNLKVIEQERRNLARREAERREEAEKLREMLDELELVFRRRVGEQNVLYGSVTSSDIGDELDARGFTVDRRKILLDDHIKKLGDVVVPIRLFPEVVAELKIHVEAENPQASSDAAAAAEPEESPA